MTPGETHIHAVNAFEVAAKLMVKTRTENEAWNTAAFGGVITSDGGFAIAKTSARIILFR